MEIYLIVILTINFGACEWILLPSVTTNIKNEKHKGLDFCQTPKEKLCTDWHNLTTMSFATNKHKRQKKTSKEWILNFQDVAELFKLYESIPKKIDKKINLLKEIERSLTGEANYRLKNLFGERWREARSPYFYYPTMESSLMTVSILLFGVYLTKVILRLLQSHYTRYNNVGMMGGIRGPIRIIKGRKKRSIEEELKKIQLMHLVGKFNLQFN